MSRDASYIYCYWAGKTLRCTAHILVWIWLMEKHKGMSKGIMPSRITCCVSQAVRAVSRGDLLQTFPLWQLRLVVELWNSRVMHGPAQRRDALLISEFLPVMKNTVDVALDGWLRGEKGQMTRLSFKPTRARFLAAASDGWMCFTLFSCRECSNNNYLPPKTCSHTQSK